MNLYVHSLNIQRHFDILELITDIMSDRMALCVPDSDFWIRYNQTGDEYHYSDLNDSNWWKKTEQSVKPLWRDGELSSILPVLMFVDATIVDAVGKYSVKPVFVSIGNISKTYRVSQEHISLTISILEPIMGQTMYWIHA